MAAKKPKTKSAAKGRKGPAPATRAKSAAKPDPVIIEPPKPKVGVKPARKPVVIDQKAIEIKPAQTKPTIKTGANKTGAKSAGSAGTAAIGEKSTAPKQAMPPQAVASAPPVKPPADAAKSRGGQSAGTFAAFALGGAVAVAIGYGAAIFFNASGPVAPTGPSAFETESRAALNDLRQKLAALSAQTAGDQSAKIRADLNALSKRLKNANADLGERLDKATALATKAASDAAAILASGIVSDDGANAGRDNFKANIRALQARLKDQAAQMDALSSKADKQLTAARVQVADLSGAAQAAAKQAKIVELRDDLHLAVAAGDPFAAELANLIEQTSVEVPTSLQTAANIGVAPITRLQQEFPAAARRALKASIKAAATGQGLGGKLVAFFKAQVGARSLDIKQGTDPDAILSQAEAALKSGKLAASIRLVRTLPTEGITEMSDWLAGADKRLAADDALSKLDAALNRAVAQQ